MDDKTQTFKCSSCELQFVVHNTLSSTGAAASAEESSRSSMEVPFEYRWPTEATLLLIETFKLREHDFSDSTKKKSLIWKEIAKELQERGFAVDGAACDTKMRTLRRRYKTIKDNASLSGRGAMKQWQFFNAMDEIMGGDPSVLNITVESCLSLASTTSGLEQHQGSLATIPSAGAPSPTACFMPSPAASPDFTATSPDETQNESERASSKRLSRKRRAVDPRTFAEADKKQSRTLDSLISSNREHCAAISGFADCLGKKLSAASESQTEAKQEKQALEKRVEELYHRLLDQKDEHIKEVKELERCRTEEVLKLQRDSNAQILAVQQQHRVEILQQHQQHRAEMNQQRQQHTAEMNQQRQQHIDEFSQQQVKFRDELKEQHQQHRAEMKEQQQQHRAEMKEQQQQHWAEMNKQQEDFFRELREVRQQCQKEKMQQQEQFFTLQQQQQQQLLQATLGRDQQS